MLYNEFYLNKLMIALEWNSLLGFLINYILIAWELDSEIFCSKLPYRALWIASLQLQSTNSCSRVFWAPWLWATWSSIKSYSRHSVMFFEKDFTGFSSACSSWQAVLNFNHISIKLKKQNKKIQPDSNILVSPEADRGNCLPCIKTKKYFFICSDKCF